jgi:hypothetical protein
MSNAALSNARNMVLTLTGSLAANRQVLIPNGIEKFYIIHDETTRNGFSLTIKTVSGTGFAMESTTGTSDMAACYSDGTNVYEVSLNTLSGSIATAQIDALAVTSAKLASFAVTSARLASFAVTTARLATNAVTAIKITQSTITQAKLAANSVGSNQLISTGVTPASYTAASITVDADGRITSASSGAAGGNGFALKFGTKNTAGASGTYTASPTASKGLVYLFSGAGGQGGKNNEPGGEAPGGTGGVGSMSYYNISITQPYSVPYAIGSVGAAGSPGPGGRPAGASGGVTTLGAPGPSQYTSGPGGNGGAGCGGPVSPGAPGEPGAVTINGFPTLGSPDNTAKNFGVGGGYLNSALLIFENTGS